MSLKVRLIILGIVGLLVAAGIGFFFYQNSVGSRASGSDDSTIYQLRLNDRRGDLSRKRNCSVNHRSNGVDLKDIFLRQHYNRVYVTVQYHNNKKPKYYSDNVSIAFLNDNGTKIYYDIIIDWAGIGGIGKYALRKWNPGPGVILKKSHYPSSSSTSFSFSLPSGVNFKDYKVRVSTEPCNKRDVAPDSGLVAFDKIINCNSVSWGSKYINSKVIPTSNGKFYVEFYLSGNVDSVKKCLTDPSAPRSDVASSELLIHPRVFRNGNVLDYNHGYECYPKSHIFCFQGNELNMQQVGNKVKVTTQAKYSYDNYVSKSTKTFKSYLGSIFKKKTSSSYDTYRLKLSLKKPNCNSSIQCNGGCGGAASNTCSSNNGKRTNCKYTKYGGSTNCVQKNAPDQKCTVDNCSNGYSCSRGRCVLPSKNRINGVSCSSHGQCGSGYCKNKKCTSMPSKNRPNNVACSKSNQCSSGYCSGGKCKTKPNCNSEIKCSKKSGPAGNTCSKNNVKYTSCEYTRYKGSSNCNKKNASNQYKTLDNCSNGYSCSRGRCVLPSKNRINGVSCSSHGQCGSGYCKNKKCTSMPSKNRPNNVACSKSNQCSSGYCKDKKCTAMPSTGRPNDLTCSSHGQCGSGYCKNKKCTSMPSKNRPNNVACSKSNQCSSGYCSGGKCKTKPNCNSEIKCSKKSGPAGNTCSKNNVKYTSCEYTKIGNSTVCKQVSAPNQNKTVDNCDKSKAYSCVDGQCKQPDCDSGLTCSGLCEAISSTGNTCSGNNGRKSGCKYTKKDGGSNCVEKNISGVVGCTVNNCNTEQGYSCADGQCVLPEKERSAGSICEADNQCASDYCNQDKRCDTAPGGYCRADNECESDEENPVCNKTIKRCVDCVTGDTNCDGEIKLSDFSVWRVEYKMKLEGGESENKEGNEVCESKEKVLGDANCDGKVSLNDFSHWRLEYKKLLENGE